MSDRGESSTIGERLCQARAATGLTQREAAARLGISRRALSDWETDKRLPHMQLPDLAGLYGVSITFLMYGIEPAEEAVAEIQLNIDNLRERVDELTQIVHNVSQDLTTGLREATAALEAVQVLLERSFAEQALRDLEAAQVRVGDAVGE